MSSIKNLKFWVSALVGLWVLITFAGLGQSKALAQSRAFDLKPPFRFVQNPEANQPLIGEPPLGSRTIMSETFGPSFNPVASLVGTTPLWRRIIDSGDTSGYYWGRVGDTAPVIYTSSVWTAAVQAIPGKPLLHAGVDNYPAGQDTWLIYGPIDMSRYQYATLSFQYYMDAEPGDRLLWGVFTDPSTVNGASIDGRHQGEWITGTFALDHATLGDNAVYLAFAFQSQSSSGDGVFIRNVQLTGEPFYYVYAPLVQNNYPATPTPTPTFTPTPTATPVRPLYGYTFDSGSTDLAEWGGAYYSTSTTKYGQCIPGQCTVHYTSPHGNPADSLRLYTNGLYSFIATSPNDVAPDNFDLYVDISPWVIYPRNANCPFGCPDNDYGDWYGIIFNASSDTFGANPSQFGYNKTYYRLYFYNMDSIKPIRLKLERCDGATNGGSNSCHSLGSSALPVSFIGNAGGFDTVHIEREASGLIRISLNGTVLITATDATYTGASHGKFGTFIFSWTANDTQSPPIGYEMQVDFDNIKLYQR